jgi:hypothetical protein
LAGTPWVSAQDPTQRFEDFTSDPHCRFGFPTDFGDRLVSAPQFNRGRREIHEKKSVTINLRSSTLI